MVKISYTHIKKTCFLERAREREREREKTKSPISRILLFHSEIGQHELQTL